MENRFDQEADSESIMSGEGNIHGAVATAIDNHNDNGSHYAINGAYPEPRGAQHDHGDSKSRHVSHVDDKASSRSKERDRKRGREKERDEDLDRHHHRRHRYRSRGHSGKTEHERYGDDRSQDRDSHRRDYDRDREERHRRHRSRSEHRLQSHSRSCSKSKRISGFDMAPPASAMLAATAVAAAGQVPGTTKYFHSRSAIGRTSCYASSGNDASKSRHARQVYVGGLPPTASEQSVSTFFSSVMSAIGGNTVGPGDPVVNVYLNHGKHLAFVEMRSVEEASNAMALNGIRFDGVPVRVSRPTHYNSCLAAPLGPSQPNPNLNLAAVGLSPGSAAVGRKGPDSVFVGGIPYYYTEQNIRRVLESFGPLRELSLIKDKETGSSKGYAFCVYQDPSVTDHACASLNGMKIGEKERTLTVKRNESQDPSAILPKPEQEAILLHARQQVALQRLMLQPDGVPTKIVCLTQVATTDDLKDDEEYGYIMEDMRQEGEKFGNLVNVVIPRPNPNGELTLGVGKVFLEFADLEGAWKARAGMNGRNFGGHQVVAVYYPEDKFAQRDYEA